MVDYKLRWLCKNVTRTFCREKVVIVLRGSRRNSHYGNIFYPPLLENKPGYVAINNDCFVSTDSGHDVYTLPKD